MTQRISPLRRKLSPLAVNAIENSLAGKPEAFPDANVAETALRGRPQAFTASDDEAAAKAFLNSRRESW